MIAVSDKFKENLKNGNRNFQVSGTLKLSNDTSLSITNSCLWSGGFVVEDAVSEDSTFQIGGTIINQCTIILNNIYDNYTEYDFYGAKLSVKVGLTLDDGTTEYVRKGEYTVVEPQYNGSLITLTCYDNMYLLDRAYDLDLSFPTTTKNLAQQLCLKSGVSLSNTDFPHSDYMLQQPSSFENTTYRTVLMWVCQICGCFARFNGYGELEIKWYNQAALENSSENNSEIFKIESSYEKDIATDDVVITGVKVVEASEDDEESNEISYLSGTDGYVVSVEQNDFIRGGNGEEISTWLANQLVGFRFRSGQVTHTGNPTLEAGDVAIFTDEKGHEYKMIVSGTTYTLNGSQTTRSSAETPVRNSSQRYSNESRNYVKNRALIIKEKSQRESAIDALNKRVDGAGGFYTTEEIDSSGAKIFYLHNKPTLEESTMAWKMTSEAFAVSTSKDDSGNFIWTAGMTVDGDFIARILTATGINASWINTGSLNIKDNNGNSIFSFDVDKKTANISGTTVSVKGKNVEQAIEDIEQNSSIFQANIDSSIGTVLGTTKPTTLLCELYKNNELIDTLGNDYRYSWSRTVDGVQDAWHQSGKKINVSATDFINSAVYKCEVMDIKNLLNGEKRLTNESSIPLVAYAPIISSNIALYRDVEETVKEYHYTKEETEKYVQTALSETDLEKVNGSVQNITKKLNETYDTAEEHTRTISSMKETLNGNNLLRNSETLIFDDYIVGNRLSIASGTLLTDANGNYLIS